MTQFDVFNGDADGICSLVQLRLHQPGDSTLVTGVKRDIKLLERVQAGSGDRVTTLDISLDKNRAGLERLLANGAEVEYFDHHFAGEIPVHAGLTAHIDTTATIGTSYLVNQHLQGAFQAWAVTGSFGDNLDDTAHQLASALDLDPPRTAQLRELGRLLNYNGYGASLDDLHFDPAELYRLAVAYPNPLDFIRDCPAFQTLKAGFEDDMSRVNQLQAEVSNADCAIYCLPAEKWARRVSGVYANDLARQHPEQAQALLTRTDNDDGYVVSVRAPLNRPQGADELCRQFASGGGRKAAAGINLLKDEDFQTFVDAMNGQFATA